MRFLLFILLTCSTITVFAQDAAQLNALGDEYWEDGDYQKAISFYTRAIKLDNNALYYFNRGYCHDLLREYDAAIRDYSKAVQVDPSYAEAFNARGFIYDSQGKFEKAIQDFTKAIKADPTLADAYNNRGYSRNQIQEYDLAIQDFNKAIRYDSKFAAAYNNRGSAKHSQKEYEEAIKDFSKAIAIDNSESEFYDNRGTANYDFGELEAALNDYNKALQLKPNWNEVYYNRGSVYFAMEKYEEAISDYKKFQNYAPTNEAVRMKLSQAERELEYQKEASTGEFIPPRMPGYGKVVEGISIKWLAQNYETYNIKTVNQSEITIKATIETENIDKEAIKVYLNGQEVTWDLENRNFSEENIFTAKVRLQIGQNDVYVAYKDAISSLLNVNFRIAYVDKNNFYFMPIGIELPNFSCGKTNASQLEKWLSEDYYNLFTGGTVGGLDIDEFTAQKIKTSLSIYKFGTNTNKGNEPVGFLYLSSQAFYDSENSELRIKADNFSESSSNKTSISIDDVFNKTSGTKSKKVLCLDLMIDGNLSRTEINTLENLLLAKAKEEGWILIASLSNDNECEQNTTFSAAIIEGIAGNADLDNNKLISVQELIDYIQKTIAFSIVGEVEEDFYLKVLK